LKKEVDVCGGCVIVRPPAGAVLGMEMVEEPDEDEELVDAVDDTLDG